MKTSTAGLDFIIAREAIKTKAYRDGGGVWTIGVGHTAMAGPPVPKAGMTITLQEAKDIFARDLVQYEQGVSKAIKRSPNQNQFDAMVSLCFNIGVKGFTGSSVVRNFNAGNLTAAANAFLLWNKDNGKIIQGLVNRRHMERALFLAKAPEALQMPAQPVPPVRAPMAPPVAKPQPTPVFEDSYEYSERCEAELQERLKAEAALNPPPPKRPWWKFWG